MAFEELLDEVGSLGRFHILQIVLVFLHILLAFAHFILENFAAAVPDHRCWVRILDNDTVSSNDTGILSHDALLRVSIPLDSHQRPERCRRFVHPQWQLLHFNETFPDTGELDTEPCMDGWVYDLGYFPSTIVTEWDLVCDYQILKQLTQILTLSGGLLGSIISGSVSDSFGRKWSLKWSLLLLAVSGTCTAFAPTYLIYCSLRLLAGFTAVIILHNSLVLAVEWTRSQSKVTVVTVLSCSYGVGQMILASLAFVFREWRTLYLVMSIPFFVFFLSSRWLVESARWLIIVSKLDEGLKALKKVANMNGKETDEETLNMKVVRSTMKEELEAAQTRTTICDLFRTPNIRKRICLLLLIRNLSTVTFYGILINLQHLGNNIFLYQGIYGALSLLCQFFVLWVMNQISYKLSQIFFLILQGLSILASTFLSEGEKRLDFEEKKYLLIPWGIMLFAIVFESLTGLFLSSEMQTLNIVLLSVALFFSSGTVTASSIHSATLIPTILRARAIGLSSVSAMFGSTLASLLMTLKVFSAALPWILYGVMPIIACLPMFCLPETKNLPVPDTMEDVEDDKNIRRKVGKEDSFIKVTKF